MNEVFEIVFWLAVVVAIFAHVMAVRARREPDNTGQ